MHTSTLCMKACVQKPAAEVCIPYLQAVHVSRGAHVPSLLPLLQVFALVKFNKE